MSLNQFNGIGNLTRDAELQYLQSGQSLLKFSVAINERYQDKSTGEWKDADPLFLECVLWGKPAERKAPMLKKGAQVFVGGKLKLDQWEDKDSGAKRQKITLTAFNVEVITRPPKQDQGGEGEQDEEPRPAPSARQGAPAGRGAPQGRGAPAGRGTPQGRGGGGESFTAGL